MKKRKQIKKKSTELDVDFIGGERSLTKDEEIAISKYIREYKAKHTHKQAATKHTRQATAKKKAVA